MHGAWGMGQKMDAEGGGQRAKGKTHGAWGKRQMRRAEGGERNLATVERGAWSVERWWSTGAVIASRVLGGAAISREPLPT